MYTLVLPLNLVCN